MKELSIFRVVYITGESALFVGEDARWWREFNHHEEVDHVVRLEAHTEERELRLRKEEEFLH